VAQRGYQLDNGGAKKVLMPPLHIKLGLVKQFMKTVNKEGEYIRKDVRKMLKSQEFEETITRKERNGKFGRRLEERLNISLVIIKAGIANS